MPEICEMPCTTHDLPGLAGRIEGRYPLWAVSRIGIRLHFSRAIDGIVVNRLFDESNRDSVRGGLGYHGLRPGRDCQTHETPHAEACAAGNAIEGM